MTDESVANFDPPAELQVPAGSLFAHLGIYGIEPIGTALLAGLATGDPILLIGNHGSAKTLLCERIGQALGLRFWAYDASKALFEDVIGFPNPADLARGAVSYVSTPLSIWDKEFVLVDEISRATPSMQNKWLEIVRSRRLMGLPLPRLKFIVAAMNPPSYLGAIPLDAALAGRFAFVLPMPEFKDLAPGDEAAVVEHLSSSDAPLLGREADVPSRREASSSALRKAIGATRQTYRSVEERMGEGVTSYVLTLAAALAHAGVSLDGRRCGMLRRNVIAYLAAKEAAGDLPAADRSSLGRQVFEAVQLSMPFAATEEELKAGTLLGAHGAAGKVLNQNISRRRAVARLKVLGARDLLPAVQRLPEVARDLSKRDHQVLLSRIEQNLRSPEDADKVAGAYVALKELVRICQQRKIAVAPEIFVRAATLLGETLHAPVQSDIVRLIAVSLRDAPSDDERATACALESLRVASSVSAPLFEPDDSSLPSAYYRFRGRRQRGRATPDAVKRFEQVRDAVRGRLQQIEISTEGASNED